MKNETVCLFCEEQSENLLHEQAALFFSARDCIDIMVARLSEIRAMFDTNIDSPFDPNPAMQELLHLQIEADIVTDCLRDYGNLATIATMIDTLWTEFA